MGDMAPQTDRPGTPALTAEWLAERYGDEPALRFRADGGWREITYSELRETVRRVGCGLIALGVEPGDRVAILSETRPEWTYAHLAALAAGAVVVPVYPTAGAEEVAWVLGDSAATVIICEDARQQARVEALAGELPDLRHVLLLNALDGLADASPPPDAAALGELLARAEARKPEDLASIVYTSGTTGMPKGCRLTHGNFGAVQDATVPNIEGGPGDTTYLYLPLAHLLAQLIQFTTLLVGAALCYFGGRIENIVAELAEVRPTHLPSVPRLFEKVHAQVLSLAESQEGGRERFEAAIALGLRAAELRDRGEELPPELREAYEAADAALFGLVRAAFGGRLRWATTGAAPIAPQTMDFMRACGLAVLEGYGMTESGGVIAVNRANDNRYGTVGRPIDGCEVRIADDGEVLARGANVFPGYHGNEPATAETLDADGWLHTGDLGALDADGYLTITGRKKDIVITSAGKNLTPTPIEFAIQQSRYVSRAVMIGDHRPYPVAVLTLDPDEIIGWASRERKVLGARPTRHAAVRELVQEAVDAANEQVARPARIRAFLILDEDLSVEAGELTPTLKIRRSVVAERYRDRIDALYAELAERPE
ncbi:long-chain fatty acid--CoA ligase [Streptomyces sp. H10-C2]|uniref:AMP-dependent synthetase/ligase n=1 Tax=unclassified Streptomyces TaxID=2593676 RepID=UPI0024BA8D35|nr:MULTISPECIES: long-chain fatty acid--CoA ligase [unclassified Streptomyces]MDJ0341964.1 long-chain fatty acid--CoA ligase [Streptomyces sp. PH10-H1]MDJ0369937.1 long-chain fatty acid--CoA ligase [Streptomyces sp. H10-C2]MDJ0370062.1 long-chain fatty acid--CoA ligase [Streptomyces sp. H10-C2]